MQDFRCFAALDWRPPGTRLALVGANGAGKTSLLEAIYLAATTRSFRTGDLATCARRGSPGFALHAEVGERPARTLGFGWTAAGATRALDGKGATLAEHVAVLPVLVAAAEEEDLITGTPLSRRRFLDRGLVHLRPALLDDMTRYRAALAEKRALVARRETRGLEAWNALLARHGARLAQARAELVAAWSAAFAATVATHAPTLPPVALRYRPSPAAAVEGEVALAEALEGARGEELARGRALCGPHRDEVEIAWDGASARRNASAGERKATALLLLAALARHLAAAGRAPTLLVDDADSELDDERLARVVAALAEARGLVVTSSRPALWAASGGLETVDVAALARR